jgi:hypothetical protein
MIRFVNLTEAYWTDVTEGSPVCAFLSTTTDCFLESNHGDFVFASLEDVKEHPRAKRLLGLMPEGFFNTGNKRYIVGYINFSDNNLVLEEILANNEPEAFWRHSKLQDDTWGELRKATKGMNSEELQDWSFDFDMCVNVMELP